jgi:hypothetical protein
MRIYTVTCRGRPLAVVRASDPGEAMGAALDMASGFLPPQTLDTREPSDAEMVQWLERRDDFLLEDATAAAS